MLSFKSFIPAGSARFSTEVIVQLECLNGSQHVQIIPPKWYYSSWIIMRHEMLSFLIRLGWGCKKTGTTSLCEQTMNFRPFRNYEQLERKSCGFNQSQTSSWSMADDGQWWFNDGCLMVNWWLTMVNDGPTWLITFWWLEMVDCLVLHRSYGRIMSWWHHFSWLLSSPSSHRCSLQSSPASSLASTCLYHGLYKWR